MRSLTILRRGAAALFAQAALASAAFGQGYILPSVGPTNGGMAGAGVAAPLDATGSLYWNPGAITAIGNRADVGFEAVNVRSDVETQLGPFSGAADSDGGVFALPAVGMVYNPEDSDFAFGLGLNGIGGFLTNYDAPPGAPLVGPPPAGFGPIYSRLAVMQVAPTVAARLTDTISFGVAPTISAAELSADPFPFNGPNPTLTYPPATHGRPRWGGGVQAGLYHRGMNGFDAGVSVKSPQWFEKFDYQTPNGVGGVRTLETDYVFPMIVSAGVGYRGFERLVLAADVRYIDYDSTPVFGDPAGFDNRGAVTGMGWKSIFLAAFGAQYAVTDWFAVRSGYSVSENPIPASATAFNLQAPAIHQHILALGFSYQFCRSVGFDFAWQHLFENTSQGPLAAPVVGSIPGTSVKVSEAVDAVVAGFSIRY